MGVNNIFQKLSERITGDSGKTLFSEDSWLNNSPLAVQFPRLYQITFSKNVTVQTVLEGRFDTIQLWRILLDDTAKAVGLQDMVSKVFFLLTSKTE